MAKITNILAFGHREFLALRTVDKYRRRSSGQWSWGSRVAVNLPPPYAQGGKNFGGSDHFICKTYNT